MTQSKWKENNHKEHKKQIRKLTKLNISSLERLVRINNSYEARSRKEETEMTKSGRLEEILLQNPQIFKRRIR